MTILFEFTERAIERLHKYMRDDRRSDYQGIRLSIRNINDSSFSLNYQEVREMQHIVDCQHGLNIYMKETDHQKLIQLDATVMVDWTSRDDFMYKLVKNSEMVQY